MVLVIIYKKIAIRFSILANPNYRTLHKTLIPKGGGVVFSIIFVISIIFLYLMGQLSESILYTFAFGAGTASFCGIIDDIKNIKASRKLIIQVVLSYWIIYWLNVGNLLLFDLIPNTVVILSISFLLVWLMNAYNFMDGIDGMAASGAIFISLTLASVLLLTNGPSEVVFVFFVLASSMGGFLIFNWPPASIFMGDAGSVFLGYIFGSLILVTAMSGDISIWTWLVVFGYFFADTTVTQIMRVILVKKWYRAHRSHAYQNLARITGSHLKVTGGVVLYNVVWILPLTLWSAMKPETALFAVVLAITPGAVFAFKYGPVLSTS